MARMMTKKGPRRRKTRGKALVVVDAKNNVYFVPAGTFAHRIVNKKLAEEAIKYAAKVPKKDKVVTGYFYIEGSGRADAYGMDDYSVYKDPTVVRTTKKKK